MLQFVDDDAYSAARTTLQRTGSGGITR